MGILGIVIAILFFVVGIIGTILPALPGAVLIWAGMLLYGIITGFNNMSVWFFVWQGVAVVLIYFIDYAANAWGVKKFGGSRAAVWGSLAGVLLGVVFMGPLGIILGPFIGAVAGELIIQKPLAAALKSGMGSVIGLIGGLAFKLVIEAGMIIWFFVEVHRISSI
ncbi:MAG: DUF456 domain-containing protein [Bacillota bacterium]